MPETLDACGHCHMGLCANLELLKDHGNCPPNSAPEWTLYFFGKTLFVVNETNRFFWAIDSRSEQSRTIRTRRPVVSGVAASGLPPCRVSLFEPLHLD